MVQIMKNRYKQEASCTTICVAYSVAYTDQFYFHHQQMDLLVLLVKSHIYYPKILQSKTRTLLGLHLVLFHWYLAELRLIQKVQTCPRSIVIGWKFWCHKLPNMFRNNDEEKSRGVRRQGRTEEPRQNMRWGKGSRSSGLSAVLLPALHIMLCLPFRLTLSCLRLTVSVFLPWLSWCLTALLCSLPFFVFN